KLAQEGAGPSTEAAAVAVLGRELGFLVRLGNLCCCSHFFLWDSAISIWQLANSQIVVSTKYLIYMQLPTTLPLCFLNSLTIHKSLANVRFATSTLRPIAICQLLLSERHPHVLEQGPSLIVVAGGGDNGHVHAFQL